MSKATRFSAQRQKGGFLRLRPPRFAASFMSHVGTNRSLKADRACPLCPGNSDINLFRYRQSVIDLDAEIPHRAFDLGMPEQELNSPEIARPPIDEGCFGATQGMRPKQPRVETDAADPLGDEAGILASCHARGRAAMSGEQELAGSFAGDL